MKRTPLTSSVEQHREWEQRTREKAMARRRALKRQDRGESPARRRAALPKRGRNFARNRREQFGDDGKREWIAWLPCLVCGKSPCHPHHEPPIGRGGEAEDMAPLCADHHILLPHKSRHRLGSESAFEAVFGINLTNEAGRLEECWQAKKACKTCEEVSLSGIKPPHNGSGHCESGSIASGGTRAHCTCDQCF